MNIKPLADRVLILPAPAEEKTIGGIIIPDTAKEKPLKGEVVAALHPGEEGPAVHVHARDGRAVKDPVHPVANRTEQVVEVASDADANLHF